VDPVDPDSDPDPQHCFTGIHTTQYKRNLAALSALGVPVF
jgi:hypothetical protein